MEHAFAEPYRPQDTGTQKPKEALSAQLLRVGDKITIAEKEHVIERVSFAAELGKEFGLRLPEHIPIYWLSNVGSRQRGAFVPEKQIVLFFANTDRETQEHELTHVLEYDREKSVGLAVLYERVIATINDDSFEGSFSSYNFRKNIHEFIADGRTKPAFIAALKKEGLYDAFVQETAYLFD